MKKYSEYMDGVSVSDTLHEKLKNLEAKEKPQAWKKYGAVVAALVLVLGLGIWGTTHRDNVELGGEIAETPTIGESITEIVTEPAPAPVPMPNSPGMEMMGGYEVSYGETVAYYYLPLIKYGEEGKMTSTDIALPVGVYRYDLNEEELLALLGGESNLAMHLDWGGYEVEAFAMLNRDGSLWMLNICGSKGDTGLEHFSLEVSPGQLPPSCLYYAKSELNNIWERDVWAESYDGEIGSSRRVSFIDRDYGYRFEITGTDIGAISERVSRLVRWIIVGDGLTFEKEEPAVNSEEMTTMPYDPEASPAPTATPVPTPEPTPEP